MARIGIVHIGFDGHVGPAARLGGVLARQGHEVIAWAPERHRALVERDGVRCRAFDPRDGRPDQSPTATQFLVDIAEGTRRCLPRLVREIFAADAEVVVYDCQAPWGRLAAEFLGLPQVVSRPLYPLLIGALPQPGYGGPDDHAAIASSRVAIAREWGVELGSWRDGFMTGTSPTVVFTTSQFTGLQLEELPSGWCYAGPLMDPPPPAQRDPGRPLVYVALGTMFNLRIEAFRAAIDGLSDAAVDVFVATGRSPVREWLGPLPDNVSVYGHVDSRAVLARASAHVTHGGASSVAESLLAGVPLVCVPQGSDHAMWAGRVSALGAGEVVAEDPGEIRAAVMRLLHEDGPRARAGELRDHFLGYDGEARVRLMFDRVLAGAVAR